MKGMRISCLLLLLIVGQIYCKDTLAYVVHIANIGARYPKKARAAWVKEPGALTAVGMRQLYLLGRQLRQKYVEQHQILNDRYNQLQLTFRSFYSNSSTVARAAYTFAAGLYMAGSGYSLKKAQIEKAVPPTNFTDYKEYQKELQDAALLHYYASVPIMTLTEEPNYPLEAAIYCPRIKTLIDNYRSDNSNLTDLMNKREERYKQVLYPAMKKLINDGTEITNMDEAMDARDYIRSAYHLAYPLNGKLTDEEMKLFNELYETKEYLERVGNLKVSQLISNTIIKETNTSISSALKAMDNGVFASLRNTMTSYMVEEVNLLAMLRLLEYYPADKQVHIPFASSLIFEFYKSETSGAYYVSILFNDDIVKWKGVSDTVPLSEFKLWMTQNILPNFYEDCVGAANSEVESFWIVLSAIIGGAILLMLAITCIFIMRKPKTETDEAPLNKSTEP